MGRISSSVRNYVWVVMKPIKYRSCMKFVRDVSNRASTDLGWEYRDDKDKIGVVPHRLLWSRSSRFPLSNIMTPPLANTYATAKFIWLPDSEQLSANLRKPKPTLCDR